MPIWGQVELLCRAISEESRKEAESILSRARTEAERTLRQAMETAEQEAAEEISHRRSSAHAEAKHMVDSAELEARRRIMTFREEIVREVFEALGKRLDTFRMDPSYGDFLIAGVKEGMDHLSGNSFLAEMSTDDLELVRKRVERWAGEKGFSLELRASSFVGGGVRVYSSDGLRLYDNSLLARLKRREGGVRQEIWRRLFGTERRPH